jgi:hypothetical protein
MHFDSINEALIACVKAANGSKAVGAVMWPDIAPDQAQRKLLNALDESRPEKLAPSQVMLILKLARDKGFHEGVGYILGDLSYAPTSPIEPKDAADDLQRQIIENQKALAIQIARLVTMQPHLRAAA